jgi:hypothetical protein
MPSIEFSIDPRGSKDLSSNNISSNENFSNDTEGNKVNESNNNAPKTE